MTVFIGDVHGKFGPYKRILKACKSSIQVGDLGVGFFHHNGVPHQNPPFDRMVEGDHRFIRGNHDNPRVCRNHRQWIQDGNIECGMMFIGGGLSVDREYRTENYDWWADEELSASELNDLTDVYLDAQPRIMVTHDCPEEIAVIMCAVSGRCKLDFPSRTRRALQSMWSAHSPDLWVFGHWHYSFDQVANGTRFICLAELEAREFGT